MTTKLLTGTYAAGYDLAAGVTTLGIAASGLIEGHGLGVPASAVVSIHNEGRIVVSVNKYGSAYNGVELGGGVFVNGSAGNTAALVEAAGYGLVFLKAGQIVNFGTILSTNTFPGSGIYLGVGGRVTNGSAIDTGALIEGDEGVSCRGGAGTVVNFGTISGGSPSYLGHNGVDLSDGGLLINGSNADRAALVRALNAVSVSSQAGTIRNFGTIVSYNYNGSYAGISLNAGGSLINGNASDTTALIVGIVSVHNASGMIRNFGTIDPTPGYLGYEAFINLDQGGLIVNGTAQDTSATINERIGIGFGPGPEAAKVVNYGTIGGDVQFSPPGVLINGTEQDTSALIAGYNGVSLSNAVYCANFGTIIATGAQPLFGAVYLSNANLVNGAAGDASALIAGYVGAYLRGASTLTNFGTIEGRSGRPAVILNGADTLVVEAGSRFVGAVLGNGGLLDLASGVGRVAFSSGSVTVSGSMPATTFSFFGTLEVGSAARFTVTTAVSLGDLTQNLIINGVLGVTGSLATNENISGAGTLALEAGTTQFDASTVLSVAHVTVGAAATNVSVGATKLDYGGVWTQTSGTLSVVSGGSLTFTGASNAFSGTLSGAGTIDFTAGADALNHVTLAGTEKIVGALVTLSGLVTTPTTSLLVVTTPTLLVAAGGVALAGGGRIDLGAAGAIKGVSASAKLVNVSDTIYGGRQIGGGRLVLVNAAGGIIESTLATGLTLDTGANTIVNAGLIRGPGAVIVQSAIINSGTLFADGGALTVNGAVSGGGSVKIVAATANFTAAFAQNVTFGASGVLELARSQTYTGTIAGFSKTAATSLDLADIAFGASTKASFSGTTASGVLTVTDGTHTARIRLSGDYIGSTFTASSDGHGGTTVVDPAKAALSASAAPHRFIAAMASLAAGAGGALTAHADWRPAPTMLVAPRVALA